MAGQRTSGYDRPGTQTDRRHALALLAMLTDELDYDLPPQCIATQPAQPRDAARLLVINRAADSLEHHHVRDLPRLLATSADPQCSGDLLIFNRSRVIPAAFVGTRAGTGGQVGGLYLHCPAAQRWQVMLESRGLLREGERIDLTEDAHLLLIERFGDGRWLAALHSDQDTLGLLDRIGSPPLPPYIRKRRRQIDQAEVQSADRQDYNTIYADQPGSVAAPTAGLHFTDGLFDELRSRGLLTATVTLHVGAGTFTPIRADQLDQHAMHSEWICVPAATLKAIADARRRGARVIPIGTTSVRTLESLPQPLPAGDDDFTAHTDLFIHPDDADSPGFTFRFTDALLTNFHLPRSTLLALVAALPGVGIDRLKSWYQLAVDAGYRFYSYGDAMLIV